MEVTRKYRYLLSVVSGLLLVLSFPYTGSLYFLSFVALVPLLIVEHAIYKARLKSGKVFLHAFITFLIYNVGTTWWIWYSTSIGAMMAFVANSLLMTLVFYFYHLTKRNLSRNRGFVCLFIYWIGFEYLHTFWELSWPWLTFGNIFATQPELVQWYNITGNLGGSLWILLTNFFLFRFIYSRFIQKKDFKLNRKWLYTFAFVLVLPALISILMYVSYQEKGEPMEVVVVQPNIDPYNDKFSGVVMPQLETIFDIADKYVTPNTRFVLTPETALPYLFEEKQVRNVPFNQYLIKRKRKWDEAELITGANTVKFYNYKRSVASLPTEEPNVYEEYYNTAMLVDNSNRFSFIHKSKLVLGVEKIPFVGLFPFLQQFALQNGGTSTTLGTEMTPKVFNTEGIKVAPVICYESIYGDFIANQCKQGADFIAVITNDGWWSDSPGYKQHLAFSRLRALENRKWVARSANTGISAFINQRGDIVQSTKWWKEGGLRQTIKINENVTVYARFGDLLGKSALIVSFVAGIITLFFRRKRNPR